MFGGFFKSRPAGDVKAVLRTDLSAEKDAVNHIGSAAAQSLCIALADRTGHVYVVSENLFTRIEFKRGGGAFYPAKREKEFKAGFENFVEQAVAEKECLGFVSATDGSFRMLSTNPQLQVTERGIVVGTGFQALLYSARQ
jgi:hypothetical protein